MKKITSLTALLCAASLLSACGGVATIEDAAVTTEAPTATQTTVVQTETTASTTAQTAAPTEADAQPLVIGEAREGEYILSAVLTNETGKDIKAVAIKDSSMKDYGGNLPMSHERGFVQHETATLYYDSEAAMKAATIDVVTQAILPPEYTVRLTFADDTTAELHQFAFGYIESGQIKLDGDLAYLDYKATDGSSLSTLEAERMIRNGITTTIVTETLPPETTTEVVETVIETVIVYDDPVVDPTPEPAPQPEPEPQTEPPTEPPTEAPTEADNDNPDNGCIGDGGLFY